LPNQARKSRVFINALIFNKILRSIMTKKLIITCLAIVAAYLSSAACTNLLVGKNASADGCTIVTYAADSHTSYGTLDYYPAADHKKGDMREIHDWDDGHYRGKIPEIAHTYNVVGNMNENQVTIAETTYGGRLELMDTTSIIDYGSLIYITLQRAKTAREAISIMTKIVAEYGYGSEGESFSIADPNEIWVMDMIGKGPKEKGAVWVARRLPDDCIAGHANQARIRQFPLNDKNNCVYAPDVISFARKMGFFKGKDADFSFVDAYSPNDFSTLRQCEARVWAYFNHFAAGMDKYLPYIDGKKGAEPMPFCVKPDRKISVRDMQQMMRDHFEGTPYDMTKDAGATEQWGVPYRFRPLTYKVDSVEYTNERAICTQQTGFVFVAQMRSWLPNPVGGVLWFGVDDANTAVFLPMYCSMTRIPHSYAAGNGDLYTLSWESAFWVNNWVANQAYTRYSFMIPDIRKVQNDIEDSLANGQNDLEHQALALYKDSPAKAASFLNDYVINKAQSATARYKKLGEYLFVKYLDGNCKKEKDGKFLRNSAGSPVQPDFPGYTQDYYRSIVRSTGNHLKITPVEK
jgi:dipeptidase